MPSDCHRVGYTCTNFGVDSSSCFPFRARIRTQRHTVTDSADHPVQSDNKHVSLRCDISHISESGSKLMNSSSRSCSYSCFWGLSFSDFNHSIYYRASIASHGKYCKNIHTIINYIRFCLLYVFSLIFAILVIFRFSVTYITQLT